MKRLPALIINYKMRDYDWFCRSVLRRQPRTAAELLQRPVIRDSERQPWKPKPHPKPLDFAELPTKALYRQLTLEDKKRILLLRYGSLTDVSEVRMT